MKLIEELQEKCETLLAQVDDLTIEYKSLEAQVEVLCMRQERIIEVLTVLENLFHQIGSEISNL